MTAHGMLFLRPALVPTTYANEYGLLPRLPTPTTFDSGKPLPPRKHNPSGGQKPPLVSVIGKKLNPQFVEWMMGYPVDWTKIDE